MLFMKNYFDKLAIAGIATASIIGATAFNPELSSAESQVNTLPQKQEIVIKLDAEEIKKIRERCTPENLKSDGTLNFIEGSFIAAGFAGIAGAILYNASNENESFTASIAIPLACIAWPLSIQAASDFNRSQNYNNNNCSTIRYEMPSQKQFCADLDIQF